MPDATTEIVAAILTNHRELATLPYVWGGARLRAWHVRESGLFSEVF